MINYYQHIIKLNKNKVACINHNSKWGIVTFTSPIAFNLIPFHKTIKFLRQETLIQKLTNKTFSRFNWLNT